MITVQAALDDFLLACRAEGLNPNTVRWYGSLLRVFASSFTERQLDQVSIRDMRNYLADLQSRRERFSSARQRPAIKGGLSVESVRGHIRALRRFWAWSVTEYRLDPTDNPMPAIRTPRRPQSIPKTISYEDLKKLMQATAANTAGHRDRAMLAFLADTGCRAAGMLSLHLAELDIQAGRAVITEKGDRTRIVPFTPYTGGLIEQWLPYRPAPGETVFCSLSPGYAGHQLSLSGLHAIIRRLAKRAGVTGRINPHSFRHGFAREWLRSGGDIATLSLIMGHADPATTLRNYAIFTQEEAFETHGQFSPMKNFQE